MSKGSFDFNLTNNFRAKNFILSSDDADDNNICPEKFHFKCSQYSYLIISCDQKLGIFLKIKDKENEGMIILAVFSVKP